MQDLTPETLEQHFQTWALIQTPPYSLARLKTRDRPYKSVTTLHAWRGYLAGMSAEVSAGVDVRTVFENWAQSCYLLEASKGKNPRYKHAGTLHAFTGFKAALERNQSKAAAASVSDESLRQEVHQLRDTVAKMHSRLEVLETALTRQAGPRLQQTQMESPGLQ